MRLNAVPENLLERIALRAGVVPTPLGDTIVAMTLARTIMVATKLGIFEVLAKGESTASEVATRCGLDQHATEVLLFALGGAGYVRSKGTHYTLAPVARKWMLKSSPQSLYDYMLFNFLNWTWDERFEDFLRTGKPTQIHQELSNDEWRVYQRAMRSLAGFSAFEVARRMPVPRGALRMLDIGGSHGYYSVMLCRLHPGLRAVVFDLPEAVAHAATILAQEGMGERIVHCAGIVQRNWGTGSAVQPLLRSHERGWNLVHGRDCRMATRSWLASTQANPLAYCAWGRITGSIKAELQRGK